MPIGPAWNLERKPNQHERCSAQMLKRVFLALTVALFASTSLYAQFANTHYDEDHYIFYYENGSANNPNRAQDAYVINPYGDVLQKWTGGEITAPEGAPGYLLENGLLLRGIEGVDNSGEVFQVGAYGILQMVDKNGDVVWEYHGYSEANVPANGIRPYCLHHDVEPLPNGNILASVHVVYSEDDAVNELGFKRTEQLKLTMEEIWELQPDLVNGGAEVVWKWRFQDHLVQDANSGLPNFGDVSNPGRFDINCVRSKSNNPRQNGNHFNMNGISYNPIRKQILFSSMKADEVFIIDHNLTTAEAATSAGDFLWRWGNPSNYDYDGGLEATYSSWRWTDGQHDPRWIVDANGIPTGNITIHNNHSVTHAKPGPGMFDAWTECHELTPPHDEESGGYTRAENEPHGPASPAILAEYDPVLPYFNAGFASGAQKLPNGHVFSGSATKFTLLEHDESGNIVWFFDCRTLAPGGGQMWKPFKYPVDYVGFRQLGIAKTNSLKPVITELDLANEKVTLSFVGSSWLFYDIFRSSDLQSWEIIAQDVPGAGMLTNSQFSDLQATPDVKGRFYRLVEHR